MNRRNFLKFLSQATIGTGVVYSFPFIIVPKNIEVVKSFEAIPIDLITKHEIYPELKKNGKFLFQDAIVIPNNNVELGHIRTFNKGIFQTKHSEFSIFVR